MTRRPARIAESDITRAVNAYRKQGQHVRVIYKPDGSTVIEPVAAPLPVIVPETSEDLRELL